MNTPSDEQVESRKTDQEQEPDGCSEADRSEESFQKVEKPPARIVIVGKTGNGKSTLANLILGHHDNRFPVGTGMSSTTLETICRFKEAADIEIVDTLDPFNYEMSEADRKHEVVRWKNWNELPESADFPRCLVGVVVVIRCDVRYTAEEHVIYQNIKELWGPDFCDRLVLAFTFGDRLDQEPREFEKELKNVCQELKEVLNDADNNYVVFNCHAQQTEVDRNVEDLLSRILRIPHRKVN